MVQHKILITGANGQLGTALLPALYERFGHKSVIASDLNPMKDISAIFEVLDATDEEAVAQVVKKHSVTQIYHLAAVLSAKGEENPHNTWDINLKSLLCILKVAKNYKIEKVFFPSSIAVYGGDFQKSGTPQSELLNPSTVYGMSKAAGEHWAQYYYLKYNLDVRSIRYPGIIGHQSAPGGGTTDYAVDIYHKAVQGEPFSCYLKEDTRLPMIFMDDAVRATIELMETPKSKITVRTSYNLQATSFTPEEIANSIRKFRPEFQISYLPDFRQKIAESWPYSLDDNLARKDWGWHPGYLLEDITSGMMRALTKKYNNTSKELCTAH